MASQVDICNMALAHLGAKSINSLTEKSEEAGVCRRVYPIVLEKSLRDFAWPFAARQVALAVVTESSTGQPWRFQYRYPSDAVRIVGIVNPSTRLVMRDSVVPWRVIGDSAGQLILADQVNATVEYTALVTDTNRFPGDFVDALALLLAAYIAPKVTQGANVKLGNRAYEMYRVNLDTARTTAANEAAPDVEADSEFERARL